VADLIAQRMHSQPRLMAETLSHFAISFQRPDLP
jgi:hypothetical protein